MTVTLQQVHTVLDPDEPDYAKVKGLGEDALPLLDQLVHGGDPMLASKAAYAAGLIGGPRAVPVLHAALSNPQATVRVAAAAGVKHLSDAAATLLLDQVLRDHDRGVRRQALHAAAGRRDPTIRAHLKRISDSDEDPAIRAEALEILRQRP